MDMKTHKKSEFKLDPITGEIISSCSTGKNNITQKDGMYPKNKIIEDHEFFEVIGKKEKFPVTDFIKLKSFQYGTEINLKTYKYPSKHQLKGVVYLFHGLFEYADRNAYLAKILSENGYDVLSLDYRGHGRSEGIRGHIDGYNRKT